MATCDQCSKEHNRKRFCSNKCKDDYHNKHNPRGLGAMPNQYHDEQDHEAGMAAIEDGWDGHKNAY